MSEPIVEQISQWITSALDGVQDPEQRLTINAERPRLSAWDVSDYAHNDVIVEIVSTETTQRTTSTRQELGTWKLYGIIFTAQAGTELDTQLSRLAETIRRTLMAGQNAAALVPGLATAIDCPSVAYAAGDGMALVQVSCEVAYWTEGKDGYN